MHYVAFQLELDLNLASTRVAQAHLRRVAVQKFTRTVLAVQAALPRQLAIAIRLGVPPDGT